jgi:FKBP-type peptidyl-prolyl cis-trans isomerase 2
MALFSCENVIKVQRRIGALSIGDFMKNGDWVKIEFIGKRASDGLVIEATSAEEAKKAGIFQEDGVYGPGLVILGSNTSLKGIEEALLTMKDGESRKVELTPENAFGPRDPTLVRIMPVGEFRKRDIDPYPGLVLNMDDRRATVRSVTGGRVTLDFNHPLAGEKLIYDVKISGVVEGTKARSQELLSRSFQGETYKACSLEVKGDVLEAKFGAPIAKDMNFIIAKTEFVANVLRHMPEIAKIDAVEVYERKQEEKEGAKEKHEGHKHGKE